MSIRSPPPSPFFLPSIPEHKASIKHRRLLNNNIYTFPLVSSPIPLPTLYIYIYILLSFLLVSYTQKYTHIFFFPSPPSSLPTQHPQIGGQPRRIGLRRATPFRLRVCPQNIRFHRVLAGGFDFCRIGVASLRFYHRIWCLIVDLKSVKLDSFVGYIRISYPCICSVGVIQEQIWMNCCVFSI